MSLIAFIKRALLSKKHAPLAAFIANGPKDIEFPTLIFSSLEKGIEECRKLFGDYKIVTINGKTCYRWMLTTNGYHDNQKAGKLFTACGTYIGCYSGYLMEIEEGKPFMKWIF